MSLRSVLNLTGDRLYDLPLAIVYVTERCNSRCVTCDFWRHGEAEISLERARRLATELRALGTRAVLLTGGEVLVHPRWDEVTETFREAGMRIWLLSAGLAIRQHARRIAELCDRVTVSLDAATPDGYFSIRGVAAFDEVVAGIDELVRRGVWVSLRTTVQRQNYRELPALVALAKTLGVRQISFLPVDAENDTAFARREGPTPRSLLLDEADLSGFASVLEAMERDFAPELGSGFVAEDAGKLRLLHAHFARLARLGGSAAPLARCNAPRFSAVVRADGSIQPCHFIPGSAPAASLEQTLNAASLTALRKQIRSGEREECRGCVCPMWKSAGELLRGSYVPPGTTG